MCECQARSPTWDSRMPVWSGFNNTCTWLIICFSINYSIRGKAEEELASYRHLLFYISPCSLSNIVIHLDTVAQPSKSTKVYVLHAADASWRSAFQFNFSFYTRVLGGSHLIGCAGLIFTSQSTRVTDSVLVKLGVQVFENFINILPACIL